MSSPLNPNRVIRKPVPTRATSSASGYSHLIKLASDIPSTNQIENQNQEGDGDLILPPGLPPPLTPPNSPIPFTHHHPSDPSTRIVTDVTVTITPPTPDKNGIDGDEDDDEEIEDEIYTPPKMPSAAFNRIPPSDRLMSDSQLSRSEMGSLVERYISFIPKLRTRIPSPPFEYANHMLPGTPLIDEDRTASPSSDGSDSIADLDGQTGDFVHPSSVRTSGNSSSSSDEDKQFHSPHLDGHVFTSPTPPPVPTPLHPEHAHDDHESVWMGDRTEPQTEIRLSQQKIEQLRLEKSETKAQVEGLFDRLQALHEHSDNLIRTINPTQVSRALVELCGIFSRKGPQGMPFMTNVDSLARAVGSPNLVLARDHNPTLLEMMSRTCHILFNEFDRSLNTKPGTLCTHHGNGLEDHLPPDVLWLFVNTADELLLLPLRDVLKTMLSTCTTQDRSKQGDSCRSIPIRLLLGEIDEDIFEDRRKDLTRYRWWAMKQRLKFERNNGILHDSIDIDTDRFNGDGDEEEGRKLLEDMNDLRRASWQDFKRCLPKTVEEEGEWDEVY